MEMKWSFALGLYLEKNLQKMISIILSCSVRELEISALRLAVLCCRRLEKRMDKNQLARQGDDYQRS